MIPYSCTQDRIKFSALNTENFNFYYTKTIKKNLKFSFLKFYYSPENGWETLKIVKKHVSY